jgi:hypothetical protein
VCVTYPHTKRKTTSVFGKVLRKMTAPTGYEAREKCINFAIQQILLWSQIEDKVRNI